MYVTLYKHAICKSIHGFTLRLMDLMPFVSKIHQIDFVSVLSLGKILVIIIICMSLVNSSTIV